MTRIHYFAGLAYVAFCAMLVLGAPAARAGGAAPHPTPVGAGTGQQWFEQVRPRCNTVEVELTWRNNPPPSSVDGQGFGAACLALGGRIDSARAVIDRLDPSQRARAAGIVFEVAHPIADAGDDRSAGPIMNMVVDYWPTHYMALYHAGMADYALGRRASARSLLQRFLVEYHEFDGWRSNAERVLKELKQ
jgi:hypothetical protein